MKRFLLQECFIPLWIKGWLSEWLPTVSQSRRFAAILLSCPTLEPWSYSNMVDGGVETDLKGCSCQQSCPPVTILWFAQAVQENQCQNWSFIISIKHFDLKMMISGKKRGCCCILVFAIMTLNINKSSKYQQANTWGVFLPNTQASSDIHSDWDDQTFHVSHWSLNRPPYSWRAFKESLEGRRVKYAGCFCFSPTQLTEQTCK